MRRRAARYSQPETFGENAVMTNGINVAALGLGGIDTSGLVSSLVSIEQQPYNQAAATQQNINSAQATISSFSSVLSALKNAAVALSDPSTYSPLTATSSDSSITGSVSGTPAPGQWSVSVGSIAQAQRTLTDGNASPTAALNMAGQLKIKVGAEDWAPISVSVTDSLTDIANTINASGLRVRASIVNDGSPTAPYHLLVEGLDTGATNKIQFDETGLRTNGYALDFSNPSNAIQAAQDASLTVGGISVTSATNQVTGAIPGVTLAITQPTTTPATITIANDSSALQQKIQTFVTAYNAVISNGHSAAGFGQQKAANTLLQGDRAVRSSLDQLGMLLGEAVPGTSGAYTTLDSVGLALTADGTLTFDTTKFTAALSKDPASVERLFVTDSSNGSQGVMGTIGSTIDSLTTGASSAVQAEITAFSNRSQQLTTQMAAMQQRTADYQTQLQKEFTQMNTALAQYKQMAAAVSQSFGGGNSSSSNGVL